MLPTSCVQLCWHEGAIYGLDSICKELLCWKPTQPPSREGTRMTGINDLGHRAQRRDLCGSWKSEGAWPSQCIWTRRAWWLARELHMLLAHRSAVRADRSRCAEVGGLEAPDADGLWESGGRSAGHGHNMPQPCLWPRKRWSIFLTTSNTAFYDSIRLRPSSLSWDKSQLSQELTFGKCS